MKLKKDFGVRAFLATLLILLLAIIVIPASLSGKLDAIQAAQIVSPLVLVAVGWYFAQKQQPPT